MTIGKWMAVACTASFVAVSSAGITPAKANDNDEPSSAKSAAVWAGVGFKEDAIAPYGGGVVALNGDLGSEGLLARASVLYVDFDFNTGAVPGKANGEIFRLNTSLGYQFVAPGAKFSIFGGVDYQNRDISPNAADDGRLDNDAVGFITHARLALTNMAPFQAVLEGNYSTANNNFWTRAQTGFKLENFIIGPEGGILGNDAFTEVRVGGYAKVNLGGGLQVQFRAGYADKIGNRGGSNSSGDGVYGGVSTVFVF